MEFEQGKGLADWENTPNRKGYTLSEIRRKDSVLDEYLRGSLAGKPSPSEADMGTLERLMFWGYTHEEAVGILTHYRWRDKLLRRNYVEGMLQKLLPLKETVKVKPNRHVKGNSSLIDEFVERGLIKQSSKLNWENEREPLTLGPYTIRVKKDLALFYEGDESKYPVKIKELASTKARKSLAKDLGVEEALVHQVAAKLLEISLVKQERPETVEQKSPAQMEVEEKADEILSSRDPIEFAADVIQKVHRSDREKSKILWLGTISPRLGYEIHVVVVGTAGVGKSDLAYVVLCCVPDEYAMRLKECSPKAIYYAVKAGVRLDKVVIYFDDVPDRPETVKLLKDIASENRADPRLWSVGVDRDFLDITLQGDFVVYASAVENLTDPGDQITRRYLVINPDENPETNKEVLEKIKRDRGLDLVKDGCHPSLKLPKK